MSRLAAAGAAVRKRRTLRLARLLLLALALPASASAWAVGTTAGGDPIRWERFPVEWRGPSFERADAQWRGRVIRRGAEAWGVDDDTPASLRYLGPVDGSFGAGDGANGLYFVETDWPADLGDPELVAAATLLDFDTTSGVLREGDIGFNAISFRWADERPRRDALDLWSVAVHESGHLLGLEHTCDAAGQPDCAAASDELLEAAMFPAAIPGDPNRRRAAADDLAGLSALYGGGRLPAPDGEVSGPDCAGGPMRFVPHPGSVAVDRIEAVSPRSAEVVRLELREVGSGAVEVSSSAIPPGADLVVVGANGKARTWYGAVRSGRECGGGCGSGPGEGAAAAVLLLMVGCRGGRA